MGGEPGVIGDAEHEKERLDADDVASGDLLAATHLHRYELSAALLGPARVLDLCCGTGYGSRVLAGAGASVHGVDVSEQAVHTAERASEAEGAERTSFERADALEFLRRQGAGDFEAVVCFEGVEHVPDPEALVAELVRLAGAGVRVILSLPNSRGFGERNRYHATDFGWEEARGLIERFAEPVVLEQSLAEGSVIVPVGERPAEATARLLGEPGRDDPAWAGHWIVLAGVDPAAARTALARLAFAAAPHQNAYMRDLELANADLRRLNAQLARANLGVHDAAAASIVGRMHERNEAMRRKAEHFEAEATKWEQIADNNDWAFKTAQRELARPRYRAAAAVFDALAAVPGVSAARRGLRAIRRSRRG